MAEKRIERVFILGMDGAGNFNQQAHTPVLDAFAARGAFTNEAQAESPTISAQCWGSVLHGVKPEKHGLTNESSASERYPDVSPYPSVFKLAREAWPEAKFASFTGWSPINYGIVEEGIGVYKRSLPDQQLVDELCAYVENNPDVKLLFLQLDEPDGSGHRHGYGPESPAYLDAIASCDRLLGQVLQTIEQAGLMASSLIIALTDHGGGGLIPSITAASIRWIRTCSGAASALASSRERPSPRCRWPIPLPSRHGRSG
ncbi:alkaline phosphatase family protein [Paenibacillus aurantiacus]|uniref:Alkaline phosphatase family protein n=1 Tax=Paenibacillus aurantiacus TaxID=1936118 RepID=A0ABV5KYA8_9BACL